MLGTSATNVAGGVLIVTAFAAVSLGLLVSARSGWFSRWVERTDWRRVSRYTGATIIAITVGLYLGGGSSDAIFGFAAFAFLVAFSLISRFSQAKRLRRFLDGDDDA